MNTPANQPLKNSLQHPLTLWFHPFLLTNATDSEDDHSSNTQPRWQSFLWADHLFGACSTGGPLSVKIAGLQLGDFCWTCIKMQSPSVEDLVLLVASKMVLRKEQSVSTVMINICSVMPIYIVFLMDAVFVKNTGTQLS